MNRETDFKGSWVVYVESAAANIAFQLKVYMRLLTSSSPSSFMLLCGWLWCQWTE